MRTWLLLGGLLHFVVLIASALTPRVLDWRANLATLHPFLRRLFWVYGGFIVLVIVLLFGATKLPQLAKALGQSKKAFREGIEEGEREDRKTIKE